LRSGDLVTATRGTCPDPAISGGSGRKDKRC